MTKKEKIAKAITAVIVKKAYRAAGQVSINGTYQPKEPKALKKYASRK
jgi:cyclic lactone autoinducer peptide